MRKQAEELAKTAASQVSDINSKLATPVSKPANGDDLLATPVAAATPLAPMKSPENISKEELLDVLQKMNKKVKALTALRTQLADRVKSAEVDKERLMKLMTDEILGGEVAIQDGEDPVQQLQKAWHQVDERNSLALQELQAEYKTVTMQCKEEVDQVKRAAEAEAQAQVDRIRADVAAETLANGNEAWEVMREQLSKRHQEEAQLLRQELHEQYDFQIAQKEEEFNKRLAETVETTRTEMEERLGAQVSENCGVASHDEIESLKAQHAEELAKLKQAAAAQLQGLKKKIAAARSAEIEKIKKETAEAKDAETAAKVAELSKLYENQLETFRSEFQAVSAEPPTEEEIEHLKAEMQTSHMEELESVKQRIALSLGETQQETLGELRQQREIELRSVKAEMQALSDAQIHEARIDAENAFNAKLEDLREKHADEMEQISSASAGRMSDMQEENMLLKDRLAEMERNVEACRAEIERNNEKYEVNLAAVKSSATAQMDSQTTDLQARLQLEFEERLRECQSQAADEAKEQLKEATCQYQDEMEALRQSVAEEKELLRSQLEIEFSANLERAQADATGKIEVAVTQAVTETLETVEQAKAELVLEYEAKINRLKEESEAGLYEASLNAESRIAEQIHALREEYDLQLKEMHAKENALQEELHAAAEAEVDVGKAAVLHGKEIEALRQSHAQEMEKVCISLEKEFKEKEGKLKADAAANLEEMLDQARREAVQATDEMKAMFDEEKEALINNLKREKGIEISNAIDQEKASTAEQLETLHTALSKKLEDMQLNEKALHENLGTSKLREESLLSELNDLKSRIAAAEEDRKMLAEAAQSGESSSKMLEERLAAQRASFEASMTALKEQHSVEKEQISAQEHEVILAKDRLENELERSCQRVAHLEVDLDSTRETLARLTNEFDVQSEKHMEQLAAIAASNSSVVNRLEENILQIQTSNAADLERMMLASEERTAQLQASIDSATTLIENVKEQHISEIKVLKEQHENELNEARKSIDEREERLKQLGTEAANWNDEHSRLLSELHDTKNHLVELEKDTLDLRKAVDEGNATIDSLKGQYETERQALKQRYEAELIQAKALADQREDSLRQLLAETADGDDRYAAVSDELEKARTRLSELDGASRDVQSSLAMQLEALVSEKNAVAEELSQAAKREAVLLSQHQENVTDLAHQLENARQRLLERERELQESMDRAVEESQSAVQTLSEETDKLKETIEAMKADHEEAISHQQQSLSRSLVDNESQLEEALRSVEIEKQSALEALKRDYEAKLNDARDKQTKAVEIVKKLKAATAVKLQGIEKERTAEKSSFEAEISSLESALTSKYDARIALLLEEHATLTKEWEAKLFEKEKEIERAHETAKDEWEKQRVEFESEQAEKLSKLEESLEVANRQLQDTTLLSTEELEQKLKATANEVHEQFAKQLATITDTHTNELERERTNGQEMLQQLKLQHEDTVHRLESEKASVLEESKQVLEFSLQELGTKHAEEMKGLQEKLAAHVDDLKRHFMEKIQGTEIKHADEVKLVADQLVAREDQLSKLACQMKDKNNEYATMEKQYEALQTKFSSDVVVKQALQKKIEELQKQLAESTANGSAAAQSLLQQQEQLEKKNAAVDEELKRAITERDMHKNKIEELLGKLEALGANLNVTLDEKNKVESELQSASRKAAKLDLAESELNSLRDQLNKLKLEQTKSDSLLEKLQAEKEANTRNHGQRTALVGMLEEQLADLNEKNSELNAKLEAAKYDLSSRDDEIQGLQDSLENAQKEMADAQNARKQANESLSSAQKGADAKKGKMIETLQREIQSLQQQMAKKSAAAQKLIQQREAECIELRKTTKALQQEVDKGSLSDRRIFELAAQQSNRESVAVSEIEVRDQMVDKLTEKLEVQDVDLAEAEYNVKHYESQVEELCRIRRREDVNLDYLKSIVVQYLSKPPGSSEREALLPVLATLLQFDANDYRTIEDGKNKLSWWGSVAPILITPPTPKAPAQEQAPVLSAEISVSRTTSADAALNHGRNRTTSLEF